jgi:hypothetical protein
MAMKLCVAIDIASCFLYGSGAEATRVAFVAEDARPFMRVNGEAVIGGRAPPYDTRGSSIAVWVRPKAEMRAQIERVLAQAEVYAYFNGSNELCRALLEQVAVIGGRSLGDLGVQFAPTTAENKNLPVANLITFVPGGCRFVRNDRTVVALPALLSRLDPGLAEPIETREAVVKAVVTQ